MFCKILNYTEHLLILASAATGCISIFPVASLVSISVGIASSSITISVKTAGIKKFKLTINKKKKNMLARTKLNTIEVLISNFDRFKY